MALEFWDIWFVNPETHEAVGFSGTEDKMTQLYNNYLNGTFLPPDLEKTVIRLSKVVQNEDGKIISDVILQEADLTKQPWWNIYRDF